MSNFVRYAVVGLGHIAQVAVLPAFEHAKENSQLTALISNDPEKLDELSKRYGVANCFSYDQYEEALRSGTFDAVYIALPNDMHKNFAIRAAHADIHVLCEKPMAMTEHDCLQMIEAAQSSNVKLMTAYRLHFEPTNMKVVELAHSGKIGELRLINSTFTMQVRDGNIRTEKEHGGGPLYDIGIYCINAARYIFRAEPIEVTCLMAQSADKRFAEVEEAAAVVMKFPGERLATFVCSFGSKDVSRYEVVGTEGRIVVEPAYEYVDELEYTLIRGDRQEKHKSAKHDQFAPELLHFSKCIIENLEPRPSGYEGLADLRVIEGIQRSAIQRRSVTIDSYTPHTSRQGKELIEEKAPVKKPPLVRVESGSL